MLLVCALSAVQFWNIRLCMEYQPVFLVTFLLCPLYLAAERRSISLTLLSAAGGCMAAFFDFLTAETVTLLLPLILVTAVRAKEKRLGTLRRELLH